MPSYLRGMNIPIADTLLKEYIRYTPLKITSLTVHLEQGIDWSLLVDETLSNGLFNQFVNFRKGARESVSILCIDKDYAFLSKLIVTSRSASQTSLSKGRMCKLYDNDYCYSVHGSKGKRVGVQSARMSMVTLTTPRRFLTEI